MSEEGGFSHNSPVPNRHPTEKIPPSTSSSSSTTVRAAAPAPINTTATTPTNTTTTTNAKAPTHTIHDEPDTPAGTGTATPIPWAMRHAHSFDLDDYFTGPRDTGRHSKWPVFLQMHGSVLPKMVLPLLFIGGWATGVTLISKFVYSLGVQSTCGCQTYSPLCL